MGKQIRFYHLKQDVLDLIEYLNKNSLFIVNEKGIIQTNYELLWGKRERYFIVDNLCNSEIEYRISEFYQKKDDGQSDMNYPAVIDFDTCELIPPYGISPRTKLPIGNWGVSECRFYLNNYLYQDEKAIFNYKKASQFIKKNYKYSKSAFAYISPRFLCEYNMGKIVPTNVGNVLSNQLFD